MDVLDIDGKEYVKSSVLARELGYTSDYIGQLCRSGKVDAKLFGRTWYAARASILGHKTNRYRSSKRLTEKTLKAHLSEKAQYTVPINRHPFAQAQGSGYLSHVSYKPLNKAQRDIQYNTDETDLLPQPRKIPIGLVDAKEVSVRQNREQLHFATPTLPEIRFRGKLALSEYKDEVSPDASAAHDHALAPELSTGSLTTQTKPDYAPINKVISPKKTTHKKTGTHILVHETTRGGYEVRLRTSARSYGVLLYTSLGLFFGLLCSALIFLVGQSVLYDAGEIHRTLFFDVFGITQFFDFLKPIFSFSN
jgi:hypothetical protein